MVFRVGMGLWMNLGYRDWGCGNGVVRKRRDILICFKTYFDKDL